MLTQAAPPGGSAAANPATAGGSTQRAQWVPAREQNTHTTPSPANATRPATGRGPRACSLSPAQARHPKTLPPNVPSRSKQCNRCKHRKQRTPLATPPRGRELEAGVPARRRVQRCETLPRRVSHCGSLGRGGPALRALAAWALAGTERRSSGGRQARQAPSYVLRQDGRTVYGSGRRGRETAGVRALRPLALPSRSLALAPSNPRRARSLSAQPPSPCAGLSPARAEFAARLSLPRPAPPCSARPALVTCCGWDRTHAQHVSSPLARLHGPRATGHGPHGRVVVSGKALQAARSLSGSLSADLLPAGRSRHGRHGRRGRHGRHGRCRNRALTAARRDALPVGASRLLSCFASSAAPTLSLSPSSCCALQLPSCVLAPSSWLLAPASCAVRGPPAPRPDVPDAYSAISCMFACTLTIYAPH